MSTAAASAAQQPIRVFDTIRVDPGSENRQLILNSNVAYQAHGDFVVVWNGGETHSGEYDVFARVFDAAGNGGEPFTVNSYTTGGQYGSSVAADAQGDFIVTWNGKTPSDPDGGILAQRFAANAERIGTEFQINTITEEIQLFPSVGVVPAGGFVVVWDTGSYGDPFQQIFARRFDENATAGASESTIAASDAGKPAGVSIAIAQDGRSLATWPRDDGGDAGYDVFARMYDANGAAAGTEFPVNGYTTGTQGAASPVALTNGSFVVAWTAADGHDGDASGIFARAIDSAGTPAGTEFQVNSFTTGDQYFAKIAGVGENRFVVAWSGSGPGGDGVDIVARVFAADATPLSDDFLVGGSATVLSAAASTTASSGSDDEPPLYPSATNVTVSITTTSTSWFPNTTYVPTTLPGGGELIGSVAGDELGRFVVSWKAYVFRASDALYVQHFTVNPPCGDIDDDGEVHATDALLALRASVSLSACTPCICDVSGSNGVTAADALLILQEAVGSEPALDCSACAV